MIPGAPSPEQPPKISVILITLNEEKNLDACLAGVRWADEIIVVDGGSSDRTHEIALKYTDQFHFRAWECYSRQKAHALSLASNEWVLSLDADERVTPELGREMQNAAGSAGFDGYLLGLDNYFLGRLITAGGWQKDRQMRLFRRSRARVTDRPVHEGFKVDGEVGSLSNRLQHFSYPSIAVAFRKINTYTSLQAIEYAESRKSSGGAIVLHSLSSFLRGYVSRGGYRDGVRGLILALLNAASTMLLYMKVWELRQGGRTKTPDR
jgi:glycosyltransferase involved in cell wall biosynthesis